MQGRFIVLEGIDGAGTTTQAKLLAAWLRGLGRTVQLTAEPSQGPIGTFLRHGLRGRIVAKDGGRLHPRAIAALFAADRADHLHGEIEPALAAGADVLCDRYVLSSMAYQGAETDPAWVAQLNAPMRPADLTLFVDVPVSVAAARRAGRGLDADLYEVDAFQAKVASAYRAAAQANPEVVIIDGTASIEAVQQACRAAIVACPMPTA